MQFVDKKLVSPRRLAPKLIEVSMLSIVASVSVAETKLTGVAGVDGIDISL